MRYRVINAGVQGYGPVEELLFFREVASAFEPDLVLVTTFVANDAVEAFDAAWRLRAAPLAGRRARDETERTLRRVVRRSIVLQMRAAARAGSCSSGSARSPAPERPVSTYLASPPHFITGGLEVARSTIGRWPTRRARRRCADRDRADAGALPARSRRVRAAA